MIKKGDMTRTAIIKTAKELFSEKGYSAVTMKDFCERSVLSRGGLYRHFSSTKEIFLEMLNLDREYSASDLEGAISENIPARQLLSFFIQTQKQEIQHGLGRLSIAVYEFCTAETDQKEYMDKRFASAVDTLSKLIKYGQSRQEFVSCDPEEVATHIVIFLEGLRLSSAVISITEDMLECQLASLYRMVEGGSFNENGSHCN